MMYHGSGMGAGWFLVVVSVLLPTLLLVAGIILAPMALVGLAALRDG